MLKIYATNAIVAKGFDGASALRFSENGDSVRFRVGHKVYDSRAENNSRWINLSVKAFGTVCERIKKMQLKEGSLINFSGRYDEDSWTDKNTGEARSASVVVLEDLEYAGGNGKSGKEAQRETAPASTPAAPIRQATQSQNFSGYEAFGGNSYFDVT